MGMFYISALMIFVYLNYNTLAGSKQDNFNRYQFLINGEKM
jgi:hypothetical protein